MSPELATATALGVVVIGLACLANEYRKRALTWQARSECWFHRAVALGWDDYTNHPISAAQAERIVADLFPERAGQQFPRPLGVPSTEQDADDAKAWRERRALRSLDHHARVIIDVENAPANDAWAAHELLLTVGGGECSNDA